MTTNRVMRLNNNPDARGFIVRVLEETHRDVLVTSISKLSHPKPLALKSLPTLFMIVCAGSISHEQLFRPP